MKKELNGNQKRAAIPARVSGRDDRLLYHHLKSLKIGSHLYGFIFFGQLVSLIKYRQLQKKYFDK